MQNYVLGKWRQIVSDLRTRQITYLVNNSETADVMLTIERVAQALPGFKAFREYYSIKDLKGITL